MAAKVASDACLANYPGGIDAARQGSGLKRRDFRSGTQCSAKMAVDTRSEMAAYQIKRACQRLYDEPESQAHSPVSTVDRKD